MSSFWSAWVIVLTVITLVLTTWILFANRKKVGDQATTGHVYDGIEEYDNPLPQWWLWLFVGTIIFGIGYLAAYPGLGNYQGFLGWSSQSRYEAEIAAAETNYGQIYEKYSAIATPELAQNPQAMTMAGRIFSNNCAQCHGSDARGAFGFPDLVDNDWLYGGDPKTIEYSIAEGRSAAMPAWGDMLSPEQATEVTYYVASLGNDNVHGSDNGKQVFTTYCASCHGADGTGNSLMGAPNLRDDVWLYGGSIAEIKLSISNGRAGKMPAHKEMLSANKIHLLTAYVYGLSHKQG